MHTRYSLEARALEGPASTRLRRRVQFNLKVNAINATQRRLMMSAEAFDRWPGPLSALLCERPFEREEKSFAPPRRVYTRLLSGRNVNDGHPTRFSSSHIPPLRLSSTTPQESQVKLLSLTQAIRCIRRFGRDKHTLPTNAVSQLQ